MSKKFRYDPLIYNICKLDRERQQYTDDPHGADNGRALANLLVSVREGRAIHVAKGPLGYPYRQTALYWQSGRSGHTSKVILNCGRYQSFLSPERDERYVLANGNAVIDDGYLFDKVLTAVQCNSPVGAYMSHGMAVMAIDRQTHSNQPGVTLDEENRVTFYYDLPREIWDDFQNMVQGSREMSLNLFNKTWPMDQESRDSVEGHVKFVKQHERSFLTSLLDEYEDAGHEILWNPRRESARREIPCPWCGQGQGQ